jgi:hypothetical protein
MFTSAAVTHTPRSILSGGSQLHWYWEVACPRAPSNIHGEYIAKNKNGYDVLKNIFKTIFPRYHSSQ